MGWLSMGWLSMGWLSMGWLSGRGDRGPVGHVDRGELVPHLDDEGRGHGHRGHGQARPDNVADHAGTPASSWAGNGAIGTSAGLVVHW